MVKLKFEFDSEDCEKVVHLPKPKSCRLTIWLYIGEPGNAFAVRLNSFERTEIMSQLHADQIVTLSLQAVDANGNLVEFMPDVEPVWDNSDAGAAEMEVSEDGLTAVLTPHLVGSSTTVSVTLSIDGVTFSASIVEDVVSGAVAGIRIVETFSPAPSDT